MPHLTHVELSACIDPFECNTFAQWQLVAMTQLREIIGDSIKCWVISGSGSMVKRSELLIEEKIEFNPGEFGKPKKSQMAETLIPTRWRNLTSKMLPLEEDLLFQLGMATTAVGRRRQTAVGKRWQRRSTELGEEGNGRRAETEVHPETGPT